MADGEGSAHPALLEFAREGLVDVVQFDIFGVRPIADPIGDVRVDPADQLGSVGQWVSISHSQLTLGATVGAVESVTVSLLR